MPYLLQHITVAMGRLSPFVHQLWRRCPLDGVVRTRHSLHIDEQKAVIQSSKPVVPSNSLIFGDEDVDELKNGDKVVNV